MFSGEKIAQILEVFDSLAKTRNFGSQFAQSRLVGFVQGVVNHKASFLCFTAYT